MTQVVSEGVPSREAINYAVAEISAFPGFGSPLAEEADRVAWILGLDAVDDLRNILLNGGELSRGDRLALFNCRQRWAREDEEKNPVLELITLSKTPLEERLCRRDEVLRLLERQRTRELLEQDVYGTGRPVQPKRTHRPRLHWNDAKDLKEAHAQRGDEARRRARRDRKHSRKSEGG